MKKVIFSAIAMIAFVGSSMASNGVKLVVNPPTIASCSAEANKLLNEPGILNLTNAQILAEYNRRFQECMNPKVKEVVKTISPS